MLAGKEFKKVFNVSGGIKAWQAKTAIGPQELGIALFTGQESPQEVLKVAYSLEQGLCDFYLDMQKETRHAKVKNLFAKLSKIEQTHQTSIYTAYKNIITPAVSLDDFEKMIEAKALEGGLSVREYLDLFNTDMNSEAEVISLAMSIEAQALDLYQRVSLKIKNSASKAIINKIANEERTHLASLGTLIDSLPNERKI